MTQIIALLFNSLWESVVALLAAALVLRIAKNANATTRYAVWTAALFCSLLLPILTTVATMPSLQSTTAQPAVSVNAPSTVLKPRNAVALPATHGATVARATAQSALPGRAQFALAPVVVLVIAALWLLAVLYNGVRFAISVATLEGLKKNATPLPIEYRNRLAGWQAIAALSHRVRLCLSDEISVPVAVGIFDAMILLPASLVDELDPDDIDRIVLHEYAHLQRGDDWINAFQRIVLALFFFNPAIRYIGRQMDIEREVSCDDSVVNVSGDAVPLASCLVKMVEKVAWPYEPLAAPGVFDSRRNLSLRVERLLQFARDRRTSISALPTVGAVAAMFTLVLIGALVSPRFVYAQNVKAALPPQKATSAALPRVRAFPKTSLPAGQAMKVKVALPPLPVKVAMPSLKQPLPVPLQRVKVTRPPQHVKVRAGNGTATGSGVAYAYGLSTNTATVVATHAATTTHTSIAAATSGDYISDLASAGYTGLSVDDLIALKSVGVDATYIRSLQAVGFTHLTPRELIQARSTGLTAAYVQEIHGRLGTVSLREVTELSALGVTGSYIDELAAAGYRGLSLRDLQQMKALGIDGSFIKAASAHGFKRLSVSELIRLKASGVL